LTLHRSDFRNIEQTFEQHILDLQAPNNMQEALETPKAPVTKRANKDLTYTNKIAE